MSRVVRSIGRLVKKAINIVSNVIGDVISWLIPQLEQPNLEQEARGALVNKQSNIEQIPVIYGERRVGGTIVFVETSGSSNNYLYICLVLAEGEVQAVGDVYINDELLTSGSKHFGHVLIDKKTGADSQTASSVLLATPSWESTDKLSGIAYLGVRLTYNADVFSGIPTITANVQGRKVYDPRTTSTSYSSNPALCLRDYLTNTRYGKGLLETVIDDVSFGAAATDCDVNVESYDGGDDVKAFSCNAVILTNKNIFDNVKVLLSGMQGIMPYQNGQYRLFIEKDKDSTFDFTIDNIIGGIALSGSSKSSKYNRVTAKFVNPDANWQSDAVIWPEVDSTEYTAYLSADNNIELSTELNLTTVTNYYQARNIAKTACLASRLAGMTVELESTSEALVCVVGDIVTVTHPTPGWDEKEFRVTRLSLNYNGTVTASLSEHIAAVYPWVNDKQQPVSAQSTLPDAFAVSPPESLTLGPTSVVAADGTTQAGVLVTWGASTNVFVSQYEVQYIRGASNFDWGLIDDAGTASADYGLITGSPDSSADYGSIADATAAAETNYNSVFLSEPYYVINSAVAGATYSVRVRAVTAIGSKSGFVSASAITYGDQTAPNPPSVVNASGDYKQIALTWINPTVADFDYVEVYRNTVNSTATASRIAVIRASLFIDAPLGINVTRYYWVKAVDRTGNTSGFSAGVSATTEFIDSDSFSAEVLNLFSEAGAYGIEPVATLPATGDFDGQIKYQTTLNKLYRWNASTTAWTDDIFSITSGSVDEASFAAGIEPIKVVAELPSPTGYTGANVVFLTTDNKLYRYDGAAWVTGTLAADIDGTLAASNFAQDLRPVEVVSALPSSDNFAGRTAVLTTDNKLYRYTGTAWTAAVNSTDISGTLSAAQIASLTAAQITGTLTNSQIADLSAAKITGSIVGTQILDGAISTAKLAAGSVSTAKLSAGAVTSDTIAANAITSAKIESGAITTAKLAAGSVTATQLAADSVSADKIQANSIGTDELAANAITAGKIAAGAIVSDKLEANAVTAGKIAAGAVSADQIAANAITSEKINAQAITSAKIKAGDIQGDRIAANTITGGLIAASGIITDTAQINDSVITNAKIANAAITTAKIGDLQVTGLKIANGAITLSAFASDNGFSRFFSAGTFTPGISGIDTFASLTFPTNVGDDITVEIHYVFNSEDYQSSAGTKIKIRPMISIAGVEKSDYSQKFWSVFETTSHIPNNLKIRVVGTGSSMTATLRMYYEIDSFYNPAYTAYEVTNCIISAFASRK